MEEKSYQLVFEGLTTESEESLRKVKGTFISELNFSIEDVQNALENAPLTIQSADDESELLVCYNSLKNAGGKVLIVRPQNSDESLDLEAINFEEEIPEITNVIEEESDLEEDIDLEFSIDFEELEAEPRKPKNQTYSLDFDPDSEDLNFNEIIEESADLTEEPLEASVEREPEPVQIAEDDELDLSFSDEEEEEAENAGPKNQEENDSDFIFDIEKKQEVSESLQEKVEDEELDLSIPDEPIFDFKDKDKEELSAASTEDTVAITEEEDLTIPDEPMFNFSTNEGETSAEQVQEIQEEDPLAIPEDPIFNFDEVQDNTQEEKKVSEEIDISIPETQEKEVQLSEEEETEHIQETSNSDDELQKTLSAIGEALEETQEEYNNEDLDSAEDTIQQEDIPQEDERIANEIDTDSNTVSEEEESTLQPRLSVESEEAEHDEVQDEVYEIKSTTKSSPSSTNNALGTILLAVIGVITLFLGYLNFFANSNPSGLTKDSIANTIKQTQLAEKKAAIQKKKQLAAKPIKVTKLRRLNAKTTVDDVEIEWSLLAKGSRLISGHLKVYPPKPADLTPEEIVRGAQFRPWLKKIEVFNLSFIESEDGKYRDESLQARGYIEQGKIRKRMIAKSVIELSFDPETDKIAGSISITYPKELNDSGKEKLIWTKNGKYLFSVTREVDATAGGVIYTPPK